MKKDSAGREREGGDSMKQQSLEMVVMMIRTTTTMILHQQQSQPKKQCRLRLIANSANQQVATGGQREDKN